MAISLNTDQYHLQTKLNLSTSRMHDYANKSVDEIIEAEAKDGNTLAKDYGRKLFNNPDELIETFKLNEPANKYNIINKLPAEQREKVLQMLDPEDMVVGLNFFTQDKLEEMLHYASAAENINVALEAFSLKQIIKMMPEEELERFFMSDDLKKEVIVPQLRNLDPEMLIQMAEGITGQAVDSKDIQKVIAQLVSLPDKQFKETMATLDPEVQQSIIFQMANEDIGVMKNFSTESYIEMVSQQQKPDMVKSMIALNTDSLQIMTRELPDDLFSVVAAQIDTKQFARYLINKYPQVLEKFVSMGNSGSIH
ncbi:hypothetical protein IKJ53_01740 [bacterium]|nr:hypothetical protein [bacterium]